LVFALQRKLARSDHLTALDHTSMNL